MASLITNKKVPLDENFMCDGHCSVFLSHSLGGSGLDPKKLTDILGSPTPEQMNDLLKKGVCLPIFFGGDCALDGGTQFVMGELEVKYQKAWIARLSSKLSIPCGKFVVLAGGGVEEDMRNAISGKPADPNYCLYQSIDVTPGNYRIDVYAYLKSLTVGLMEEDLDEEELQEKYKDLPEVEESYVVQLTPLKGDVPLPPLVEEVNWPGNFELR